MNFVCFFAGYLACRQAEQSKRNEENQKMILQIADELKKLEKEPGLCASNPYIYVYTKGHVRKYRIFSFYETTDGSATYDDFEGTDGYDQYVKRCLSKSTLAIDEHTIDFAKRPALLTLSTCIGRSGGPLSEKSSKITKKYCYKSN